MPFKSEFAKHPDVAKKFAAHETPRTSALKRLLEKRKSSK